MKEFLKGYVFLIAEETSKEKQKKGKGIITIVNAERKNNGNRITFSKELQRDLKLSDEVQIAIAEDGSSLMIGVMLDEEQKTYKLRRLKKGNSNSRLVLYNKKVVEEITKKMNLQFENKVSITFYGIEYIETEKGLIARVWEDGERDV